MSSLSTHNAMQKGILSTIGNTPLIPLTRLWKATPLQVFAKLEMFNPTGSAKDRVAFSIIENALSEGTLLPGMTVIESSSGNMGIALAQICLYFGLKFICIVDPSTTEQNLRILEAYGVQIELVTEPDAATGEFLQARINRVKQLLSSLSDSFWPQQYSNPYNPLSYHRLMSELVDQLGGDIDYLLCATSTCGTLRGCAEYICQKGLQTKVIAVDAKGSVIFGGLLGKRLIPGHGASRKPELYQPKLADEVVLVSDQDCIIGCHRLLQQEAILAGGSSGGVVMAFDALKHQIAPGARCVLLLCDRGERYLSTVYSMQWIREQFGDIAALQKQVVQ